MARLSVVRVRGGTLAIDCQADTLAHLATRFTVPLLPSGSLPSRIPVLHPEFEIEGEPLVMATHLAGAIPRKAIEETIATLEDEGYAVQRALDMLTGSGF